MEILCHVRYFSGFEHLQNQHRVVSRQRATTFGDDVRMRHLVFVGSFSEDVDNIVDIFLHGIVHRTLRVGRACAIIVHPKTTAAVHEVDVEAHLAELHIILCHLAKGSTDQADFRNLTTDVEVDKLQAIFQSLLFQTGQCREQFGTIQTKF